MKPSKAVGRNDRAAWVTRAEAAYLARVGLEEVDRWVGSGRLAVRRVGVVVLVDLSRVNDPARSIEARPARDARARAGRADHLGPQIEREVRRDTTPSVERKESRAPSRRDRRRRRRDERRAGKRAAGDERRRAAEAGQEALT